MISPLTAYRAAEESRLLKWLLTEVPKDPAILLLGSEQLLEVESVRLRSNYHFEPKHCIFAGPSLSCWFVRKSSLARAKLTR